MSDANPRLIYACRQWEIDLGRRELRLAGAPVPLGSRAFEIMGILVQSATELVTKDALMEQVWPGTVIGDASLHVHISAVRKALGADRNLLRTTQGRGYRLLGSWTARSHDGDTVAAPRARDAPTTRPATNFPVIVTRLIGRSDAVRRVRDLISAYRVATLTGPGGIGKTALAMKAVRGLLESFGHGAWLVELASLSDADLVPATIAGVLELRPGGERVTAASLARAIGNRHLLLLLDNCEHLIDAVAELVETLVQTCPRVTVLATSREVMRIQGEYVYRVPPLDVPALGRDAPDHILTQSAVELFITRAAALDTGLSPRHEDLPTVAEICRRLDGVPLAIELAAARAAFLGTQEVARGLRDRFALLTSGRRGVVQRHRTLRATLDWSYALLPASERCLLRRLAVFAGAFSLEAAGTVTQDGDPDAPEIATDLANLVMKSLVSAGDGRFRLLETTQVYALARLTEAGELADCARRHAAWCGRWLAQTGIGWSVVSGGTRQTPPHLDALNDARAALDWCFGPTGDTALGVRLAAAAVPVFLGLSLLPECHRWSERALLALDDGTRAGSEEMYLQASLGVSSMHMHGPGDMARAALSRSLEIADAHGDGATQVGLLGMLSMLHTRDGHFDTGLDYARRSGTAAATRPDATTTALAQSTLGRSLQFAGDHRNARIALEASFQHWSRETSEVHFGFDHQILVGIGLARSAWLQGHPTQAATRARDTIADAQRKNHPASLALALAWVPGIFLWLGDLSGTEEHADWLVAHAEANSLGPYLALGRGYRGILAIRRGAAQAGVDALTRSLQQLRAARYAMLDTEFEIALVQGLVATQQAAAGLALIDRTIRRVEESGERYYLPEALRVKGGALLALPQPRVNDADACLMQALALSRDQDARAWELRIAIDLAALAIERSDSPRARTILRPVFERFVEGADTADLQAAESLLKRLG